MAHRFTGLQSDRPFDTGEMGGFLPAWKRSYPYSPKTTQISGDYPCGKDDRPRCKEVTDTGTPYPPSPPQEPRRAVPQGETNHRLFKALQSPEEVSEAEREQGVVKRPLLNLHGQSSPMRT
ncbi:hypothetical protein ACOMHN_051175 [Nucella lapillus]